jgi:hypothetical protein
VTSAMPNPLQADKMTTTDELQREKFQIEGMKYDILISHAGSGDFHGEWHCSRCDRGDVSANRLPNEKSARQWARHCVAIHHALVHAE